MNILGMIRGRVPCAVSAGALRGLPAPVLLCTMGWTMGALAEPLWAADSSRAAETASSDTLGEIIVTAQKRSERLQDVPVPVTAVNASVLVEQNLLKLQDYYTSIPGLSFVSNGRGDASLSIRGLTTGSFINPTVGITLDDVPLGSTTILGTRSEAPDLDPSDLERVEVLRGPQGTLYGAATLGGLLKYVTVDPSSVGLSGRIETDIDNVQNGYELGYGVRGAANVPLGDNLAVRISGFTRRDPGYINDAAFGEKGVNKADVEGGHLSLLWHPLSNWSLKLSALIQDTDADGQSFSTQNPGSGQLQQILTFPGAGWWHHELNLHSATVAGSFDGVNLASITGYSTDRYRTFTDCTAYYGFASQAVYGVSSCGVSGKNATYRFSQELRLSGSALGRLDWLVGVFYDHEDTPTHDIYYGVNPVNGALSGITIDDPYPTTYEEYAGFGDLTLHFTDQFDIQFGARESKNRQTYEEILSGPGWALFGLGDPAVNPLVSTNDNSFTYLATPRFKLSPNLMVYARVATGYRPGSPNPTCILFSIPCHYQPDKTTNYEIGLKGESPNHLFSFDSSIYYINWKNIQLQVNDPTTGAVFYTNGSAAKSEGVELSGRMKPVEGLTITAWVAWNEAVLTADLPPHSSAYGLSGDRLPYTPRISGNLALDEEFPLTSTLRGFVGGSLSYVGNRENDFATAATVARLELPSYTQENLRAGVHYDTWTASFFVNNLSDQRGVLVRPLILAATAEFAANYIQPRTVGLSISKTFGHQASE